MFVVADQHIVVSSYYPGRGDNSHVLASLNQETSVFYTPKVDNDDSQSNDDPVEDELPAELVLKQPNKSNKFLESLVIEVSL